MSNPRVGPLFSAHEPRRCDYAPCANGCVILGGCPEPDPAFTPPLQPKEITRGEISREIVTINEGPDRQ